MKVGTSVLIALLIDIENVLVKEGQNVGDVAFHVNAFAVKV
jgi:hypothetical protein